MEAIALFFTKFADELLMAQAALLFFAMSLATYWMLVRKKKRETAEWVPAALVRAYLDRIRADERDTRIKLFGEDSAYAAPLVQAPSLAATTHQQQVVVSGADPGLVREVEALRSQLSMADQRSMEFDRMMNGLKAEKSALEQKLAAAQAAAQAAQAAAGSGATAVDPVVQKELQDLRAKLEEYGIIEDEIANVKKLQKENEQLKQQLDAAAKGGPVLSVVPGGASAGPAPSTTIQNVTEKINTPVTVIPGGQAAPGPQVTTVSGGAAPSAAASEMNTNVLQSVTPTVDTGAPAPVAAAAAAPAAPAAAPAAPAASIPTPTPAPAPVAAAAAAPAAAPAAPEKSTKQKEEELLSEFEKMLAS